MARLANVRQLDDALGVGSTVSETDAGALPRGLCVSDNGGQMKAILRGTAALYLCCASTVAFAGKLPGGTGISFLAGYNEAWFWQNYGTSIASNPSVFCLISSSFDSY